VASGAVPGRQANQLPPQAQRGLMRLMTRRSPGRPEGLPDGRVVRQVAPGVHRRGSLSERGMVSDSGVLTACHAAEAQSSGPELRDPRRDSSDDIGGVAGSRIRSRAVIRMPRARAASSTRGQNFAGIPRVCQCPDRRGLRPIAIASLPAPPNSRMTSE